MSSGRSGVGNEGRGAEVSWVVGGGVSVSAMSLAIGERRPWRPDEHQGPSAKSRADKQAGGRANELHSFGALLAPRLAWSLAFPFGLRRILMLISMFGVSVWLPTTTCLIIGQRE